MTRKGKGSNNHPDKGARYMPTPEEIEAACAEIRAKWPNRKQVSTKRETKREPKEPIFGRLLIENPIHIEGIDNDISSDL